MSAPAAPAPVALPPYAGIACADVCLVRTAAQAGAALSALLAGDVVGFDTESKPTFRKGEESTGPHLIQLASDTQAYLFPVGSAPALAELRALLESPHLLKVGFGLRDDLRRLQAKLGIAAANVLDLARVLRENKRGDVGVKTAVARFLGQELRKSKKISTTNWANAQLSERQMLYAADDAQAALRVYRAWRAMESAMPSPGTISPGPGLTSDA